MAKSSANKSAAKSRSTSATFTMTGAQAGPAKHTPKPPAKGETPAQQGLVTSNQPLPPPAPAAPQPAPVVQPFLTPPQQAALDAWNFKYANDLSGLQYSDATANVDYSRGLQADQLHNAQQGDLTNQSMAARGLFQSSIRDNALNDLATTLAQQQNLLTTTRDTALFHNQQSRVDLAASNTSEQANYWGQEVANAQAVPPVTQPPPAAPTTPAPVTATPPAAPSPAVPKPPAAPKPAAPPAKGMMPTVPGAPAKGLMPGAARIRAAGAVGVRRGP